MKKLIVAALALLAIQFATGSSAEARRYHRYYNTGYGYGSPAYYGNGYNYNNGYSSYGDGYIGYGNGYNNSYDGYGEGYNNGYGGGGWNHRYYGNGRQVSINIGRRWY